MTRPDAAQAPRGGLPRVVVVTRATEYELLLRRHATHAQAAFFLQTRRQAIGPVHERHLRFQQAKVAVSEAVPAKWRRTAVQRHDLDRFVFEPDDLVVALGQDGLVANLAKYLQGQLVLGINPDPHLYDGVLVPHAPEQAKELLLAAQASRVQIEERTMVQARLDDGQTLLALNEIFIGHRSHQSARYRIRIGEAEERHSSSGLIVATGTGATGWARSINRQRNRALEVPEPTDPALAFFVREAFPSVATGTDLTEGTLSRRAHLDVISELDDGGVLFGDGIEEDHLDFAWGMTASVSVAETRLRLAH
jgi:NAD kinase